MGRSTFLGLLALVSSANAGWQIQCFSRLYDQRIDPIANPNAISPHVHVIAGGNGFAADMDYAKARASTCLTCNVREDLSNYWTPKLYFHADNGSFINVPIEGDNQYGNLGGMAIYYNDHRYNNEEVEPFPENFRMIAGDTLKRSNSNDLTSQAIMMECVDAGGNVKYPDLPDRKCSLGIVAEIVMPSCWNGVDADSDDHKSHVSYPMDVVEGGQCPPTHPVRLMTMTYKVTYRTDVFQDLWSGQKNPFVFSNGDPTAYGFHGDFFNGWDINVLKTAANNCSPTLVQNGNRCQPDYTGSDAIFTHVTDQGEAYSCKTPVEKSINAPLSSILDDPVNGVLSALPGCNPLTYGPDPASKDPTCDGQTSPSQTASQATSSVVQATSSAVKSASSMAQSASITISATKSIQTAQAVQTTKSAATSTSTSTSAAGSKNFSDMTSKGYKYIGCGSDDPANRTISNIWVAWPNMSVNKCIDFCKTNGYTYAGTEWSSECWCGNTIAADRAPKAGSSINCSKPCNGDSTQICGGDRALSLYQACSGGNCINSPVSRIKRHLAVHQHRSGHI